MTILHPICFNEILNQQYVSAFPLSQIYLNNSEFQKDKYEWFYVTDDSFSSELAKETCIGLVCLTENKYLCNDNLHLSVLEVAEPIRHLKFGSHIVKELISSAIRYNYKTLSLQLDSPSLANFYSKFGFQKNLIDEHEVWTLNLED